MAAPAEKTKEPYRATYREYVEAIYELEEENIDAIQARIADWLGVSRASVSEMVHRLEEEGLVEVGRTVKLTEAGRHLAEVVVRRHRLAERFLSEVLGLPWVKVHAEAEVWEHTISDDVEAAMWKVLGDPKTCPHGNPIPGAGYRPPKMKPIADMDEGETLVLERISEELELDADTMDFLDRAGLRPGQQVTMLTRSPHDTFTVQVGGHDPVGVGSFVAERVFVAVV
ncbi:MAG: iron-dependent repressor IdeR [Acidimicrobiia bacterium]|nr:MAG: iron-dependent repressor IdeR [Acidimicrobiia bacterium]